VIILNIISRFIGNTKKIIVFGELKNIEDRIQFFAELVDPIPNEMILTFMNARILDDNCLLRLLDIMNGNTAVKYKIITFHSYLYSYFLRFNIHNVYYEKHNIFTDNNLAFKAIAIAGSTDSLDKILKLIPKLPKSNASIFIVQHVKEGVQNLLPELLKGRTEYAIATPKNGEIIEAEKIYIAPSGVHMSVLNGKIYLDEGERVNYARPSIDVLLKSLTLQYKEKFCAILLCGYGTDGYKELKSLRENNSKIIVENPMECGAKSLLINAINLGNFDAIMSIEEISEYLSDKIGEYYFNDVQYIDFLQSIYERYGFDYKNYESESIKRRIYATMVKLNSKNFKSFSNKILSDADLFEELFLEMSITVTEFFRDEDTFSFIKEKILPYLNSYLHIKIWCAGCSTGEEPYSMAILLKEMGMLNKSQIYATDINPYSIEEAKNGLFNKSKFIKAKENYKKINGSKTLEEYFDKKDDIYIAKKNLKDKILFFHHSLLEKGIINEFQLILCRNVMIYFNSELQEKVILLFNNSLDKNGFLVLGKSETIRSDKAKKEFKVLDKTNKIYKKIIKNNDLGD